jgi:hypothetical protein
MPIMFEVYYRSPADIAKEADLTSRVADLGGRLDYREDTTEHTGIILTYEFDDRDDATKAADLLRQLGEHVQGPMDYAA